MPVPIAELSVQLVGSTAFHPPVLNGPKGPRWDTDADGGSALAEFAGRACYQSWAKPNPATATNFGYLDHILDVGHLSVLEHGTATLYITGVSRSLTHELVRHRHHSPSQLSQRYVDASDTQFVMPPEVVGDPELEALFHSACGHALDHYDALAAVLERRLAGVPGGTERRKRARQAARSVLPNAAETRIVLTGNYRAWRHLIAMRATVHADVEIRALAVRVLELLQQEAPNVFGDFDITIAEDGTRVASSPYTAPQ